MPDLLKAFSLPQTGGEKGARNLISDVPGVRVGHATVSDGRRETGVTALIPCHENPYINKLPAACYVLNGFGKTAGTVQISELGTLETPILLTNTLNVGLCSDALVEYMINRCNEDGIRLRSVNPLVCECNDGGLNDITLRAVGKNEVFSALSTAAADFEQGAVGGGRGMVCFGLKGGIGSSSRIVRAADRSFTLGVLVQTNFGSLSDFTLGGKSIGRELASALKADTAAPDKGSMIAIVATDAPLSDRQLGRVLRRISVGTARLGAYIGHGSGEVFTAFSTANKTDIRKDGAVRSTETLSEEYIEGFFRAAADAAGEAVLNSMLAAKTVTGFEKTVVSLRDAAEKANIDFRTYF